MRVLEKQSTDYESEDTRGRQTRRQKSVGCVIKEFPCGIIVTKISHYYELLTDKFVLEQTVDYGLHFIITLPYYDRSLIPVTPNSRTKIQ